MLQKSMEKLSSGYRINRAGDDAAGLQLSESLRAQIRGSQKALDNTQDGINVLNIADGAFQTIENNLQRIRELAVQAANDTYNTTQRGSIGTEIAQLLTDVDRIAKSSEFNGVKLLDGTLTSFLLHVGPNDNATGNDEIDVAAALTDMTLTTGLTFTNYTAGAPPTYTLASNTDALTTLTEVDAAIASVNASRGNLGAFVNRLEGTANNLSIQVENLSSSESRIRNVDVASESAKLTQAQILQQAANTILAQANQAPQLALQLLKGG
jgi:flagellin